MDLENAQNKFGFRNLSITSHIGVDIEAINLVISLAREAEKKSGLF
jgi:precorrin-8X/cobalt-precorrin-8 methylmutase